MPPDLGDCFASLARAGGNNAGLPEDMVTPPDNDGREKVDLVERSRYNNWP